jgi:hypothetical protein
VPRPERTVHAWRRSGIATSAVRFLLPIANAANEQKEAPAISAGALFW